MEDRNEAVHRELHQLGELARFLLDVQTLTLKMLVETDIADADGLVSILENARPEYPDEAPQAAIDAMIDSITHRHDPPDLSRAHLRLVFSSSPQPPDRPEPNAEADEDPGLDH